MLCARSLVVNALLFTAPAASSAQAAVVHGRVLDGITEAPVAAAVVEVLADSAHSRSRTLTGAAGEFTVEVARPGNYSFRISGFGYAETTTPPIQLAGGDTVTIIVRIGAEPVRLPALEVVERARGKAAHPVLGPFYERAEARMGGTFILREEIDRRGALHTTHLLQGAVPGVNTGGHGGRGYLTVNRRWGGGCGPVVYLDGTRLTRTRPSPAESYEAANLVHPSSIEGIEVHRGLIVPAEFVGAEGGCGVIGIWTRRGV